MSSTNPTTITCPHCSVTQKLVGHWIDLSGIELTTYQCLECTDFIVSMKRFGSDVRDKDRIVYPQVVGRRPQSFQHCDEHVFRYYEESCAVLALSASAAGAIARKALELILEQQGYNQKWLAEKIDAAQSEKDPDRRLPRRVIERLSYLKETGNFGVHIPRNTTTSEIVEAEPLEVEACLDTIEELIIVCYEQPAEDAARRASMNEKLTAAGLKPI